MYRYKCPAHSRETAGAGAAANGVGFLRAARARTSSLLFDHEDLKGIITAAKAGDMLAVLDRNDLEGEWRNARLLRLEDTTEEVRWRLLTEDGVVIDEPGDGCPAAGFSTDDLLADVGMTYYISHDNELRRIIFSRRGGGARGGRGGGRWRWSDDVVVVEQTVEWDLQRVVHVESGKVGTVRTRAGSNDAAMVANKLIVIFDDGRGEHVVVKPDDIATAVKVLTKEEDILPQERRASKLLRASRARVAVEGILLGRLAIDFGTSAR